MECTCNILENYVVEVVKDCGTEENDLGIRLFVEFIIYDLY